MFKNLSYFDVLAWLGGGWTGARYRSGPLALVTDHFVAIDWQAYDDVFGVACNRFNEEPMINRNPRCTRAAIVSVEAGGLSEFTRFKRPRRYGNRLTTYVSAVINYVCGNRLGG